MSKQDEYSPINFSKELEQPEIQQALTNLIGALPKIDKSLQSLDNLTVFSQAFLTDRQSIDTLENRLKTYPIDSNAIEAGIQLVGKLPMLLQLVELLEGVVFFVQDVLSDEQSMEQINASINQFKFVQQSRDAVDIAKEVKNRLEVDSVETISLFTILRWLKDPTVQQGLRIVKTTLAVLGQREDSQS